MAMAGSRPRGPNILITGTPGTGKTTLAERVAELTGMQNISVGKLASDMELFDGYDHTLDCPILDDDKVVDEMEDDMSQGGCVAEYHGCEFFPERWFDIVFVLRASTNILYDRLQSRGYSAKKVESNMDCEIFQVILEEARDSYPEEIVHELQSDTPEQLETNVEQIVAWVQTWRQGHGLGDTMMVAGH